MPKRKPLTLGDFRKRTQHLPDATPICPRFGPRDIPSDIEPGVELRGFGPHADPVPDPTQIVALWVRLFYLNK